MRSIGLAAVSLQGFIDAIERGVVYGWAWNPQRPDERIKVEILHGDQHLATVTAEQFRSDLVDLEIGDGHHAFEFALPDTLGAVRGSEIEVRFADSVVPLPRMQVRPMPRSRSDGASRADSEIVAALQARLAMQEQVIADMSNLLNGLVERIRDLPLADRSDAAGRDSPEVMAELEKHSGILQGLEVYMATFGQSLRDLAERLPQGDTGSTAPAKRSRTTDLMFLLLMAGAVIGFVIAFGDVF